MTALFAPFFLLLGAGAGAAHFAAIACDADLIVNGGSPLAALGLRLGRMLLAVAVLAAAALHGGPVLAAAAIGFMGARRAILGRERGRP